MDIILSHTSALEALRSSELRGRLEREERCTVELPALAPSAQDIDELSSRLAVVARLKRPVNVLVAKTAPRTRSKAVTTHFPGTELPPDSLVPVGLDVYCVSPEHLAVQMAPQLTDLELTYLLSELLGIYAIAPAHKDGMIKRDAPITTRERIENHLDQLGSAPGTLRVRRVLRKACVGSASPRETKLSLRLGLGRAEGGYCLNVLSMNEPLEVKRIHDSMTTGVRKPDILLRAPAARRGSDAQRGVAVEYDGIVHAMPLQHAKDVRRHNELTAIGINEYLVTDAEYGNLDYMDGLIERIRDDLGLPRLHPTRAMAKRWRARRQELKDELDKLDGLSWNGRERARRAAEPKTEDPPVEEAAEKDEGWDVVPVDAYGLG